MTNEVRKFINGLSDENCWFIRKSRFWGWKNDEEGIIFTEEDSKVEE